MAEISDFDELDRRIIEMMSTSSEGSFRQLAIQLNIHPTTLIQRVKNLRKKGVITGSRAKVDYMKLGFGYMGIVQIYMEGNILGVQDSIKGLSQVVAVFDVTGDCDSIVWVACKDRDEFSSVLKTIMSIDGVKKTNTSVVLNMVKDPFDFIPDIV